MNPILLIANLNLLIKICEPYEIKLINSITTPQDHCAYEEFYECNPEYPYRTHDGTCNNYANSWWGKSSTPLKRLLNPVYDDEWNAPKQRSVTGTALPNPRNIAMKLHYPRDHYTRFSNILPHFAQYIDHDITLTALSSDNKGVPIKCSCDNPDVNCINIPTPADDKINQDQKCMVTQRSAFAPRKKNCNLGYREQMNSLSHWLDMSQTYGNDFSKSQELRLGSKGYLNSSLFSDVKKSYLPYSTDGCFNVKKGAPCFQTGDIRINQNLLLTSIHTIFMREHNRVATLLSQLNPYWTDEQLYQEARRICIAQYQHIIFNEWLPVLIGKSTAQIYDLMPMGQDYFYGYDSTIYPSVSNEFSTAAFRFGHTLIRSSFSKMDENYRMFQNSSLKDIIFNPLASIKTGGLDPYVRGCLMEGANRYDPQLNDNLNNHLFEDLNNEIPTHRFSLAALNVNRGRDHGLPGYNQYRALCGLNYANDFDGLDNIPRHVRHKMKEIYAHVDDIDLFTGGTSEEPVHDGIVGPTFAAIIAKTFRDLKYGDRFYYENGMDEQTKFRPEQLCEIKKVTLSRILCDNVDLKYVQKNAFLLPGHKNRFMSCNDLPSLSLDSWKS